MNSLAKIIEETAQLSDEEQEQLIQVLQQRRQQNKKAQIAHDAQQSLLDFRAGNLRPQSAEAIILELRQSLDE